MVNLNLSEDLFMANPSPRIIIYDIHQLMNRMFAISLHMPWNTFGDRCNLGMVALEKIIEADDILELKGLIEKHHTYTGSEVAGRVLNKWEETLTQFVKVMPLDYKRVLQERKEAQKMVAAGG